VNIKTTAAAILSAALLIGGIRYFAPSTTPATMTVSANYSTNNLPKVKNWIFEWIYTTNLNNPYWQVYTQVVGTNVISIPTSQFKYAFFTVGRILDQQHTNYFIISDVYTNQYYKN